MNFTFVLYFKSMSDENLFNLKMFFPCEVCGILEANMRFIIVTTTINVWNEMCILHAWFYTYKALIISTSYMVSLLDITLSFYFFIMKNYKMLFLFSCLIISIILKVGVFVFSSFIVYRNKFHKVRCIKRE